MNRRTCLQNLSALGLLPLTSAWTPLDNTILKRSIPSSNEKLTAVGVGTWQTFDAGDSSAEREPLKGVLKTLIEQNGNVTKVWTSGEQEGIRQMNNSFSLLKREKMDLMQIHNLVDWQIHLKTLQAWKEAGKVRYIGITHYTESAYSSIEKILNNNSLDFLQINYSLVSRKAEERLFPLAQEKKVAVIINQPFEEGSLFNMVKGKKVPEWTKEFDCNSWAQFFLKFILSNPTVTCVIPGTAKPHHMLDNMGAAYGRLPTESHRAEMIKFINA